MTAPTALDVILDDLELGRRVPLVVFDDDARDDSDTEEQP